MNLEKAKGVAFLLACVSIGVAAVPAARADDAQNMHGMKMDSAATAQTVKGESTQPYKDADAKMMSAMEAPPYTGDADRDFVAHMIPHHQGAVEMAEVELKYGKDPAIRKLAAGVVKAQREEIAFMKRWQAKHGGM